MDQPVFIEYYEAEDGSFIVRDPLKHPFRQIVEPFLTDDRIGERVYTLRKLCVPSTDEEAAYLQRNPKLREHFVRRFVHHHRQLKRELAGAFA